MDGEVGVILPLLHLLLSVWHAIAFVEYLQYKTHLNRLRLLRVMQLSLKQHFKLFALIINYNSLIFYYIFIFYHLIYIL